MLRVAFPSVNDVGDRNRTPIWQDWPGSNPAAGQLLLAIWKTVPLVEPEIAGVSGPVDPEPAGAAFLTVTFCTPLKFELMVKKISVVGDAESLTPVPLSETT